MTSKRQRIESVLRRSLDVIFATVGLVCFAPLFLLIAIFVKVEDGGTIFYAHPRVGQNFSHFRLLKFRTMVPHADRIGGPVTVAGDARVTHVGKFLRKYKLDELPQLLNVLRGEISLVGSRPESERYVTMFRAQYRPILLHRPGITDPATLAFRDEESLLQGGDTETLYTQQILPRKLELSARYLDQRTFFSDLKIILLTLWRIARPQQACSNLPRQISFSELHGRSTNPLKPRRFSMKLLIKPRTLLRDVLPRILADVSALCIALFLAFSTYFVAYVIYWKNFPNQTHLQAAFKVLYLQNMVFLVILGIAIFALSGFYAHTRTYQNRYKLFVIANAVTWTFLVEVLLYTYVLRIDVVPRGVMLLAWLFSLLMIGGSRCVKDYVTDSYSISRKRLAGTREIKNVLIIGGAGYIGSALSGQLLDAGYRVRVLDSLMFGDGAISGLVGKPNFELLHADFRHIESLVKAMHGVDAVVHLAALVGDPACTIRAELTTEINYAAARMVVEVCKGAGVNRLLFASTCSVYGASDFLMDERSATNPISLYAQTKLDSEREFLAARSATLHPTCLRLATVFGLSPRPRFDLVVNLLTARAIQDGKIMIFNQEQWRPFIHVQDVARAFVCALQAPVTAVSGEVFNVGSYYLNYSLGQVAEKIREHIPSVEIEYKENPDKRNYRVSFDKIHSYLGFTCQTGLEQGIDEIRKTIESGLVKNYRDKVFSNYEYLLGAGDDLLKSEPGVLLFSVLEPADAPLPAATPKVVSAAVNS